MVLFLDLAFSLLRQLKNKYFMHFLSQRLERSLLPGFGLGCQGISFSSPTLIKNSIVGGILFNSFGEFHFA